MDVERRDRLARALVQLPPIKAPDTLLPRIMAAVHAWAAKPWYQRAWFTWPAGGQMAAVGGLLLFGALVWRLMLPLDPEHTFLSSRVSSVVADGVSRLETYRLATRVLSSALQPVLLVAVVIVAAMTGACLVGAFIINRAIFGRT